MPIRRYLLNCQFITLYYIAEEVINPHQESHAEAIELTESQTQEHEDNYQPPESEVNHAYSERKEKLLNQDNSSPKEGFPEYDNEPNIVENNFFKENGINDIRELEEELKQNLIKSNSNFENPTLEEPSPAKLTDYGLYHSNMIDHMPTQPSTRNKTNNMAMSKSNPVFGMGASTTSTHIMYDRNLPREPVHNPTPKCYNFAINDQISMFSSQDKTAGRRNPHMNTSDLVEYSRDPSTQRRNASNNADTLERDPAQPNGARGMHTNRTDTNLHNFHSFNPDLANKEYHPSGDAVTENHPKAPLTEDAFSFDKKNLFSIEDLNSNKNKPLKELHIQKEENQQKIKESGKPKVKPLKLPKTTFKAQKHKKLIDETKRFNVARISADSPVRTNAGSSKGKEHNLLYFIERTKDRTMLTKDVSDNEEIYTYNTSIFNRGILMDSNQLLAPNTHFFKFVHTSKPF